MTAYGEAMHPLVKLALDLGPLLIFFVANAVFGIFSATAVFMAAMLIVIATGFTIERKISPMPLDLPSTHWAKRAAATQTFC